MRYVVAAEGSQEPRSRGLPWRNRPPQLEPAGVVHALDVEAEQVACGRPLAGLVPFRERDWERGVPISRRRCPGCVQVTGFGSSSIAQA
jgi:hypothetical protein